MSLPDTFSRRKRQAAAVAADDVYQYDDIPNKLRVQIVQIWTEAIGEYHAGYGDAGPSKVYDYIVKVLRKELGVFELSESYSQNVKQDLENWFLTTDQVDLVIDAIEITFRVIDGYVRSEWNNFRIVSSLMPDDAIKELNARFLEAGVGFQFVEGNIIQINSLIVHSEIILPVLRLISQSGFESVNIEFRQAHKLFRDKDYELCLTECCKAFESTIKVIGDKRGWRLSPNDTASKLVAAVFENNLVPPYMLAGFTALRSLLESAVPSVRNKSSGHGAGTVARIIPEHLAAFQLHQTASAILFLVTAHQTTP